MKRLRLCTAVLIAVLLITFITTALSVSWEDWKADIAELMDQEGVPEVYEIRHSGALLQEDSRTTKSIACQMNLNGVNYGFEFEFELNGMEVSSWGEVQNWLSSALTKAVEMYDFSCRSLAEAVDQVTTDSIRSEREFITDRSTAPVWTDSRFTLTTIRVSSPCYLQLSIGSNGEEVRKLQSRLIELGFLSGEADGIYGSDTEQAVKKLQEYIREQEEKLIDEHAKLPTPTPVPTDTPTPSPTPTTAPTPRPTHDLMFVPKVSVMPTATPSPEPTPYVPKTVKPTSTPRPQPVTQVNGIADACVQAYLYSAKFASTITPLRSGARGEAVKRLQTRLSNLGCMDSAVDGIYGDGTIRAVQTFQYFNGLNQTGAADADTLDVLYSSKAVKPSYATLSYGVSGTQVLNLQKRLRLLGFMFSASDGNYGNNTKTAVETLQKYMQAIEKKNGSTAPATPVNGIADPLLLAQFYSSTFPSVPNTTLKNGTSNDDVSRVQRRLKQLDYFPDSIDGLYGGQTISAIKEFQECNGLAVDGICGMDTMNVLFTENAVERILPYVLKVSTSDQRVYVYGRNAYGEYTDVVKTMICSTGRNDSPTPLGVYKATTGRGAKWHYFKEFDCWAQYAYYIEGNILFHSVLFSEQGGSPTSSSVNNLGSKASHGCVRLSVEDAKWIWENCPNRTKVIIY